MTIDIYTDLLAADLAEQGQGHREDAVGGFEVEAAWFQPQPHVTELSLIVVNGKRRVQSEQPLADEDIRGEIHQQVQALLGELAA